MKRIKKLFETRDLKHKSSVLSDRGVHTVNDSYDRREFRQILKYYMTSGSSIIVSLKNAAMAIAADTGVMRGDDARGMGLPDFFFVNTLIKDQSGVERDIKVF